MQLKRTFDFSTFVVLVYTPSDFARALVSDMCRALRFKAVISKRDYAAAWDALTNNPVDIIFADVEADGGCRLLKAVRNVEISPNPHLPFIATALASSPGCIQRARDCGATEFLRFPLSASTLIARIVHVVEHPRTFIKAPAYAGPDRRRKRAPVQGEERRKEAPVAAHEARAADELSETRDWKVAP